MSNPYNQAKWCRFWVLMFFFSSGLTLSQLVHFLSHSSGIISTQLSEMCRKSCCGLVTVIKSDQNILSKPKILQNKRFGTLFVLNG